MEQQYLSQPRKQTFYRLALLYAIQSNLRFHSHINSTLIQFLTTAVKEVKIHSWPCLKKSRTQNNKTSCPECINNLISKQTNQYLVHSLLRLLLYKNSKPRCNWAKKRHQWNKLLSKISSISSTIWTPLLALWQLQWSIIKTKAKLRTRFHSLPCPFSNQHSSHNSSLLFKCPLVETTRHRTNWFNQ